MFRFCKWFVLFFIAFDLYASTLCVNNDMVMIGFSNNHKPISGAYNSETFEWSVSYDGRGTIIGVASCVDFSTDGTQCATWYSGDARWGCPYVAAGYSADLIYQGNMNGSKCWCKITHPFESKWVHITMSEDCVDNCAKYCALSESGMLTDNQGKFRKGIFSTVGMDE